MEYQFENVYTYTREKMEEYTKYVHEPYTVRTAIISSIVLLIEAWACWWSCFDLLPIVCFIVVAAILVRRLRQPKKQANQEYETMLAYYDDVMPPISVRFGEVITIRNKDNTRILEYRKIKKVLSMKHSYVIIDKKSGVLLLNRDGFTKGTFEEFKQFLRTKRPDLTVPE